MQPARPRSLQLVQEKADAGDAKAQKDLADRFQGGGIDPSIFSQDWEQAKRWYEKSAAQDYAPAQFALGLLHYHGRATQQDFAQAASWFEKAANQGEAKAQYLMGTACYLGRGVAQSYVQAAFWYAKAPTLAASQNNLGGMYERGEGVPQDLVEAAKRYSSPNYPCPVGLHIEPGAYYNLRKMFEMGRGVSREALQAAGKKNASVVEACDELRKIYEPDHVNIEATASDHPLLDAVSAEFHRGLSCQYGIGCPQDILGAINAFSRAADRDFVPAQRQLGTIYSWWQDPAALCDYALVAAWHLRAASQGDAHAQAMMANLCQRGHGVPQDRLESLRWQEKAANQGHANSQYLLGLGYRGWRDDPVKALYWLKKAAEQGHLQALFTLGMDFEDGRLGTKDLDEALNWYEKAANLGDNSSRLSAERLRTRHIIVLPKKVPGLGFEDLSTAELCAQIQEPASVLELLRNMKFVMDHDLILRDDFYTEEYLKLFSGGQETRLSLPELVVGKSSACCYLSGFSKLSPLKPMEERLVDTVCVTVRRAFEGNDLLWAATDFSSDANGSAVSFEDFTHIFGHPTAIPYEPELPRTESFYHPDHPIVIPKPTHPHGNTEGVYVRREAHFVRFISIVLGGDGSVRRAHWSTTPIAHENKQFGWLLRNIEKDAQEANFHTHCMQGTPLAAVIGQQVECFFTDGSQRFVLIRGLDLDQSKIDYPVEIADPDGSNPRSVSWSTIWQFIVKKGRMTRTHTMPGRKPEVGADLNQGWTATTTLEADSENTPSL